MKAVHRIYKSAIVMVNLSVHINAHGLMEYSRHIFYS